MAEQTALEFKLEVSAEDATEDELDRMTRQLLSELRNVDVESAELAGGEAAPAGTKSVDPVTIGTLAITVLPTLLPKVVDFIQAWALRGQGRMIKFKGKIAGRAIEFEGSAEDLQKLISTLSTGKTH